MVGKTRAVAALALCLTLMIGLLGCSQAETPPPAPVGAEPEQSLVTAAAQRVAMPEFSLRELSGERQVSFPLSPDRERVTVISFFSPG